ncbi:MAG: HlyC/CorC family transporter [Fimbriimonadaceae bacterium]|nr:HlyC/CorC family transporter [Fimbriimonadaceae bacterium]
MDDASRGKLILGLLLVLGNGLFVAAEFGLIQSRRSRIEPLAKRGNRNARALLRALDDLSTFVAGSQIAITLFGIGIGALVEPVLTDLLEEPLAFVHPGVLSVISVIIVAFPLVVFGELVPKYVSIRNSESLALFTIQPLVFAVRILSPLVWLFKITASVVLKAFGIDMNSADSNMITRDEIEVLVKSAGSSDMDIEHAHLVGKALRLDQLHATDIMAHRVDIGWIPIDTTIENLSDRIGAVPHSRIPVCGEDLDDIRGILYLQDLVKHWHSPDFDLAKILRPVEIVPETITADRIVARMREAKTQILIVRDEYGGTSGLVTLEDVIEEVFGDLEDRLEAERPPIEAVGPNRIIARGDVRYDELLEFLDFEDYDEEFTTETLAEIAQLRLKRIPVPGDSVEIPIGKMRVETMTRRRVVRVSVTPARRESEEEKS